MLNRRQLLRNIGMSAGACSLTPFLMQLEAQAVSMKVGRMPLRFVFVIRSNGVLTNEILPQGVENVIERPHAQTLKNWVDTPLKDKSLAQGMNALEPVKEKLTLIQRS